MIGVEHATAARVAPGWHGTGPKPLPQRLAIGTYLPGDRAERGAGGMQAYSLVEAPLDQEWHTFDIAIDENGWITADVDGKTVVRAKGNAVCGQPTIRVWAGSAEFREFSAQP